jgi:proteasome component ECM29
MGFSSIAKQAEAELLPHLAQLVPRLYRYQFDPNPKTAESMKNIWKTLVKDPKVVETHFDSIIKELLKTMGDKMWRTREASCSGLKDLMHSRKMEELEPYMQDLWTMSFRALDDIKESVRKAAFLTCKTLTSTTIRFCDPTQVNPANGQRIMDIIIPFLLQKGLASMSEEVQTFSLSAVLKLLKVGGILLVPHVSVLIITLLESLSSLEPSSMNYLTFHTDKYNITADQLDQARLSAAKTSPILEAVDFTIPIISAKVLESLVPKLCVLIRKGVGLPTKAGCARFVYLLTSRVALDFKQYSDQVMVSLIESLNDRSAMVRKSFSTAIAHVARLASPSALKSLVKIMKETYVNAQEDEVKASVGVTLLELTRHSPEVMKYYHSTILPLAFMGMRDITDPQAAKVWQEVWEENTAGSNQAIRTWTTEILAECQTLLKATSSWPMKRQVGKSITDIAKAQGESISKHMEQMLLLLKDELTGRTWDGKEAILEALATVCIEGKLFFQEHPQYQTEFEDIMIREARKNNKPYRRVAIDLMGQVFFALKSERFEDVKEYLLQVILETSEDDSMDIDEDRIKPMMLAIQANAFKAVGQTFPFVAKGQGLKYLPKN